MELQRVELEETYRHRFLEVERQASQRCFSLFKIKTNLYDWNEFSFIYKFEEKKKGREDIKCQEIPERAGWQFFRIQSTEWFYKNDNVCRNLLRRLNLYPNGPSFIPCLRFKLFMNFHFWTFMGILHFH